MCIDPGIGGTGWAVFHNPDLNGNSAPVPVVDSGVIRGSGASWIEKSAEIAGKFKDVLDENEPTSVVIEWPQTWAGSQTSVAATLRGDLLKLAHLCGMLYCDIVEHSYAEVSYITPGAWKGQLPKDVVIRRIQDVYPGSSFPNHAADAVGMGLSLQGAL